MDSRNKLINLKIRRYDLSQTPEIVHKTVELPGFADYNSLKMDLIKMFQITEDKVIKIRNKEEVLIPISFLIESLDSTFFVDIANISCGGKNETKLLQDAYVDALQQKINSLESRVSQSELLVPQLEWKKQAYMEETINALMNKVQFLNKRYDELLPQYRNKMENIS